jgi:hypothetical protein
MRVEIAARDESMKRVPQFMADFHVDLKLAQAAIDQITRDNEDAKADEFGVRQVELFHNPDGKVNCLLEAPDAEAVRSHHAAHGVPRGHVHGGGIALRFPARGESNGDDHCFDRDVTPRAVYSEPA